MRGATGSLRSWFGELTRAVLFIAAFCLAAEFYVPLRLEGTSVSPVWLPTGLSMAAVLVFGYRFWPVVFLGSAISSSLSLPLLTAIGLGFEKALECLIGTYLMRRLGGYRDRFDSVRHVLSLVAFGSVAASIVGATVGVTLLWLGGTSAWSELPFLWGVWWLGDAVGVLIVVPLALVVNNGLRDRLSPGRLAELGAALVMVSICGELPFGARFSLLDLPLAYLAFPAMIWAVLRFGLLGSALSGAIISLQAIAGTIQGLGPFVRPSPFESLGLLETYIAVSLLTALILGAVTTERGLVADQLRDSNRRYDLASSAARIGVWDWDLITDQVYVDPALRMRLGYPDTEAGNQLEAWREIVHPEDWDRILNESRRYLDGETPHFRVEYRLIHENGTVSWFVSRGTAVYDDSGVALRMLGTFADITDRKLAEVALRQSEQRAREQLAELEQLYQTAPVGLCLVSRDLRYLRINERLAAINGSPVSAHIGRTLKEVIPAMAEMVEPLYRQVFETGVPLVDVELQAITPGWQGTVIAGYYPVKGTDGSVQTVSTMVQDITMRKRTEVLQSGSNRVLERLARGGSLSEVLTELALTVERQHGTGVTCSILTLSEDGSRLGDLAAPSLPPSFTHALDSMVPGSNFSLSGLAVERVEMVVIADIAKEPPGGERDLAIGHGFQSCWAAPIRTESGKVLGTVTEYSRERHDPTQYELLVTETAAHLSRVTIEHRRALDALTRSESALRDSHARVVQLAGNLLVAQEEERRRVSRELHDGLNQQLAAFSFEIGKLRSELSPKAEGLDGLDDRLRELQQRTSLLIDDARRMSHELHPSILEHLGLVAALRAHCEEVSRQEGIPVHLHVHDSPEISRNAALCLFRVTQEGVRNAAQHSGADRVDVTLDASPGSIELVISDDGSGFDGNARTSGGLGLLSMEERVRLVGGSFRVKSRPRSGTRVEVRVPIFSEVT